MNLEETKVRRKESKNDKRFYTSRDIAIIKKDVALRNSQFKRGELKYQDDEIVVCGCGAEGCFVHFSKKSHSEKWKEREEKEKKEREEKKWVVKIPRERIK